MTDEFAEEEVESKFRYQSGYKPRLAAEQMVALKATFPVLDSYNTDAAAKALPAGAEGMFLIPRWQSIASIDSQAVEVVLSKLKDVYGGEFRNYREGALGSDCFRQTAKKEKMFQKLGDEQKGHNVLAVPAQLGLRHRGRSVRRARVVMEGGECGLGAFEVGIMLLTHPDRFAHNGDLWIDCAGDEYAPLYNGEFYSTPCFGFKDGCLIFDVRVIEFPADDCGSASAFFSEAP